MKLQELSQNDLMEWVNECRKDILLETPEGARNILKRAVQRVKQNPKEIKNANLVLDQKEKALQKLGVKKNILDKFFGFFRKHKTLAAVGVVILLLLTPFAIGTIGKVAIILSRVINLALSGLYVKELLEKKPKEKDKD